jgi:hypothetical protein
MYIYNVTINVSEDVHEEWIQWMKEKHIPDVMNTGCFKDSRILKVMQVEDEGHTYSFQYFFETIPAYEKYQAEFAPALQAEVRQRYADKFSAFRTLLEVLG